MKRRSSPPTRRLRQRVDHQVRLPYGSYQFRVCGFGVRAPPPLSADDRDHANQRPRRQRVPERSGGLISSATLHDTFSRLIAPGQGYQGELLLDCSDRRPPTLATLQRRRRHAASGQPDRRQAALVSGALRVGRDHIAATVNTLFLAYAGAALPSLILFVTGQDSLGTVATIELVAVEVVRALCGSVGLIAAVP
jgi:YibE/F-like protein